MGLGPTGAAVASAVAVRAAYRATRPEDFDFDSWEECWLSPGSWGQAEYAGVTFGTLGKSNIPAWYQEF
jgi:hypothetical protein